MKRRNLFGALVVLAVSAFTAQARTITLNGNVHDSNGNLVTGTHTVGVAIFSSQTGGTPVWTETHTGVSFSSGNFSITVGDQTTTGIPDSYFGGGYWYAVAVSDIGRGELGDRTQVTNNETTWTGFWKRGSLLEAAETGSAITASAFPNPFTSAVSIDVTARGSVDLVVYDMLGREVARPVEGLQINGESRLSWAPAGVPPGTYILRARVDGRESASVPVRYVK